MEKEEAQQGLTRFSQGGHRPENTSTAREGCCSGSQAIYQWYDRGTIGEPFLA